MPRTQEDPIEHRPRTPPDEAAPDRGRAPERLPDREETRAEDPTLKVASRVVESAVSGVASLFSDAFRVAVLTGVLYFMGLVYYAKFAESSGLPIDVFNLPTPAVFAAPYQTLMTGSMIGLRVGVAVVGTLLLASLLRELAAGVADRLAARRARQRTAAAARVAALRAAARAGRGPERGDLGGDTERVNPLESAAYRLGTLVLTGLGVVLLVTGAIVHAGNCGEDDGASALEKCRSSVRVIPVKDATFPLAPDARYCGRYGPDHLFVQGRDSTVVVVKESQVSGVILPRVIQPRPAQK